VCGANRAGGKEMPEFWVMGNTEEVDQKFAAAGIKRTKPTFAQR